MMMFSRVLIINLKLFGNCVSDETRLTEQQDTYKFT